MSVHVTAYVWEHSAQKGTALLLLLAIADIAHKNGVAFPSVKTLSSYIRMSERNTQRVLAVLEKADELEIRRNAGPHGTHLYRVKMNLTMPLFTQENRGDKLSYDRLPGDIQVQRGVTSRVSGGDITVSPEPKELKAEPEKRGAARLTRLPADFKISDNVRRWAKTKGFDAHLDEHLEKFVRTAQAGGKKYADWDKAFENCIADDWGDVRRNALRAPGTTTQIAQQPKMFCRYCQAPSHGHVGGVHHCGKIEHLRMAMDGDPAPQKMAA